MGGGDAQPDVLDLAERVGRAIGAAGGVLVSGGLGGTMEAACRGAHSAGGTTVGILPGDSRLGANEYLSVSIPTGLGEMRNMLVVHAADVLIALPGEYGTLSEIAFALRIGKPVVGLQTWELSKEGRRIDAFPTASEADQAVRLALELADE